MNNMYNINAIPCKTLYCGNSSAEHILGQGMAKRYELILTARPTVSTRGSVRAMEVRGPHSFCL